MLFTTPIWYVFRRHISTYPGRADDSSKTEQEEVCIYHKEPLDVRVIDIPYLTESIICWSLF